MTKVKEIDITQVQSVRFEAGYEPGKLSYIYELTRINDDLFVCRYYTNSEDEGEFICHICGSWHVSKKRVENCCTSDQIEQWDEERVCKDIEDTLEDLDDVHIFINGNLIRQGI